MQIQSLNGSWQFRQANSNDWLSGQVPGGVHTDLLELGRIPDPFVADNEKRVQWVAEADWIYRRNINVSKEMLAEEQVNLVCDGLDTLGRVYINGSLVGCGENMFRQYRWNVKPLLKAGENEVLVYFELAVAYGVRRNNERPLLGVSQAIPGGVYVRKAPCQFGWDWGPMLPPVGIWKDIRLEGVSMARFEDVHLRQFHVDRKVTVEAGLKLERLGAGELTAHMVITAPRTGKKMSVEASLAGTDGKLSIEIPDPQLWWPCDYGEQPLYTVDLTLAQGGEHILDKRHYQLGLRTIELRRQPDQWGESFTFVVNGVPVFAKGSDWIPADSFPTRITAALLNKLLGDAVATHQNMLRVWGGGFYESETFYDICDRLGILVWQDFVYACSIYPLDEPEFHENVHIESVEAIQRLRHRASLALWCGNNEMETGWEHWHWERPDYQILKDAYEQFFFHTLPAWVAEFDPDHPYWPSSPSSNTLFKDTNSQDVGDMHYWDVWHGRKPFIAYREVYPRFMSEFGFQALPPFETIKTYASEPDWNMNSYLMEYHQRSGNGNGLMLSQMTDTFRMPKDFQSLVYLSMLLQAEGIRYGVEHWRRHPRRVSGIIYWQLNDCWPVASWSSLDYFGRWKALHYAARRFYAPVMLSIFDQLPRGGAGSTELSSLVSTAVKGVMGSHMGVFVTNDTLKPWQGKVRWALVTLHGEVLQNGEAAANVAAQSAGEVCSMDFKLGDEQRRKVVFVAELMEGDQRKALNVATFAPNKHLELVDPGLEVELEQVDKDLVIDLTSSSLARFVEVSFEGLDIVLSDNYFDVPAGYKVTVTCTLPNGKTPSEMGKLIKVRSLRDTY